MNGDGRRTAASVYPPVRVAAACAVGWWLAGAVALAGTIGSPQPATVDRLVAVVEQRALMQSDVELARRLGLVRQTSPEGPSLVEQLVTHELMRLEVERFAVVDPPPRAVQERLVALADGQAVDAWLASLSVLGVPAEAVRRRVADDLRIAAYLDQRFTAATQPTEAEVVERARAEGGGGPVPAAALAAARAALVGERRAALIEDWVAGLRRRASVRIVSAP